MSTAKPKINPNQHLCCVTIDYISVLLPADKGIKLVELLRGAVRVEKSFDSVRTYRIKEEVDVEYESAKPSQVRHSDPAVGGSRQAHDGLLIDLAPKFIGRSRT